jgi:hypothetical protein
MLIIHFRVADQAKLEVFSTQPSAGAFVKEPAKSFSPQVIKIRKDKQV